VRNADRFATSVCFSPLAFGSPENAPMLMPHRCTIRLDGTHKHELLQYREFLPNSQSNYYRGDSHAIADTPQTGRSKRLAESEFDGWLPESSLPTSVNGRLMLPETAIDDYVAKNFVEANSDQTRPALEV
jgi:hypothetical protein